MKHGVQYIHFTLCTMLFIYSIAIFTAFVQAVQFCRWHYCCS